MLFNTIDFIIFFIFVLLSVAIIQKRKFQHLILLLASLFFFYYSSNYLVSLLIASILIDYYVGKKIWEATTIQQKKLLLILSLGANLGLLGFFKYVNFSIEQFNTIANSVGLQRIEYLDILLPIGISFYTFQTMSYTIDIYRGKISPCNSLREFALFVSFFPQLVAGPIVRAYEFLPQLREKTKNLDFRNNLRQITIHRSQLKFGISLMTFGFFKKMFFADNIAPLVNNIFTDPIGAESFTIVLGAIAFGVQIYSDFSGYSDIAIGAAMIMGFKLPMNFNKPYFASSPSDFWRRWHMSLSRWLRDYLYIPLGGNRVSEKRTYFNLATVMFLGGLWHGASWNFVIWGMLHGLYLAIHKMLLDKIPFLRDCYFFRTKIGKVTGIFITQYLVFLTWIAFRVREFDPLLYSLQKYVFLDFEYEKTLDLIIDYRFEFGLIVLFFIFHFISYLKPNVLEKVSSLRLPLWGAFLGITFLAILLVYGGSSEDFIYFQF